MKTQSNIIILLFLAVFINPAELFADAVTDLADMQKRWATVNYTKNSKTNRKIFKQLIKDSIKLAELYTDSAEINVWTGIINSSYAGVASGLSGLSYAKDAKVYFEKAIKINGDVLSGSAYTSLGILYSKVPGWPIGFGDEDKALELLQKGLAINPDGIDSNYFYADYLYEQKQYKEARTFLEKALQAPVRPTRPNADKGRKEDIKKLLAEIVDELD
ncbi:MAG: tetratricopeptide (TPR) repeat protein [Enterobacterales bacterium]|jgi:tetratricopeptide (TPR) repeat protein